MLVLARLVGQDIVIGEGPDAVLVSVLDCCGDQVRLGFTARRDIRIDRAEVRGRIEADRAAKDAGVRAFGDGLV